MFNGEEDMGKQAKNGLRGSQSFTLNCGFVEYLWRDVWEVFSDHNLFALMVMHSGRHFFSFRVSWKLSYSKLSFSPIEIKVPFLH